MEAQLHRVALQVKRWDFILPATPLVLLCHKKEKLTPAGISRHLILNKTLQF